MATKIDRIRINFVCASKPAAPRMNVRDLPFAKLARKS
jgi:hypothetical protein